MEETKHERVRLRQLLEERTVTFILGAFGFVAGLAWNDAIQSLIQNLFPVSHDSLPAKFIYAISITLIVVVVSALLLRPTEEKK